MQIEWINDNYTRPYWYFLTHSEIILLGVDELIKNQTCAGKKVKAASKSDETVFCLF